MTGRLGNALCLHLPCSCSLERMSGALKAAGMCFEPGGRVCNMRAQAPCASGALLLARVQGTQTLQIQEALSISFLHVGVKRRFV